MASRPYRGASAGGLISNGTPWIFCRELLDRVHSAEGRAHFERSFEDVVREGGVALLFPAKPVNFAALNAKIIEFSFEFPDDLQRRRVQRFREKYNIERDGGPHFLLAERTVPGDGGDFGLGHGYE